MQLFFERLFIEPDSPWENDYIESFNVIFRDELLNCEIFDTLTETEVLVEMWRHEYNRFRPHSSLAYIPLRPLRRKVTLTKGYGTMKIHKRVAPDTNSVNGLRNRGHVNRKRKAVQGYFQKLWIGQLRCFD
jgi:hypothetical protein